MRPFGCLLHECVEVKKNTSNNTLVKFALFYVCCSSTKLLKVIKKLDGIDQHPVGASVLQL